MKYLNKFALLILKDQSTWLGFWSMLMLILLMDNSFAYTVVAALSSFMVGYLVRNTEDIIVALDKEAREKAREFNVLEHEDELKTQEFYLAQYAIMLDKLKHDPNWDNWGNYKEKLQKDPEFKEIVINNYKLLIFNSIATMLRRDRGLAE